MTARAGYLREIPRRCYDNRPPGEIPPGWHAEYRKIVRKLQKARPGAAASALRDEAVEILKNRNI